MNKHAGYIGIGLALLSILWSASAQWQDLKNRVESLERENQYLHGTIDVPSQETRR